MGKYQLVRKLATGGMAEVFLAKAAGPMGFEKTLVVKRILPHLAEDPVFVEMFLSEAKLAAGLNHANIVQIFDFGMEGGAYFIAMEYVEGLDLRTLTLRACQQGRPISYPLGARVMTLACEGLAYAHELVDPDNGQPLGLIHRDISPDNILVSKTGGVKVLDFGIAKAVNVGHRTRSGVLKGKVAYMAPEYLMGQGLDARGDVYALGVVLFELVAGRKPFQAENDVLLMQAVLSQPVPDVRTLRTDVPAELVHVISRALTKHRGERYQSCREMLADIERFLFRCDEPVGALQIGEFVRRIQTAPTTEIPRPAVSPAREGGQETPHVSTQTTAPMGVTSSPQGAAALAPSAEEAPTVVREERDLVAAAPYAATHIVVQQPASVETEVVVTAADKPSLAKPNSAFDAPYPSAENPPAPAEEQAKPTASSAEAHSRHSPLVEAAPSVTPEMSDSQRRTQPARRWWVLAPLSLVLLGVGFSVWRPMPFSQEPGTPLPETAAQGSEAVAQKPEGHPTSPLPRAEPVPTAAMHPGPTEGASSTEELRVEPSTTLTGAPPTPPAARATLRVDSNLGGQVFFNGKPVGKAPLLQEVEPGTLRIKVAGTFKEHRFDKIQVVQLHPGENPDVMFLIQKVSITIRGHPDDMVVKAIDGHILQENEQEVTTYEGWHKLKLYHPPTGKSYTEDCQVKIGDKLCKFSVELP